MKILVEEHFKLPTMLQLSVKLNHFMFRRKRHNSTVAAMDMLVPGIGESIGGSMREDDYEKLYQNE